MCALPSHTSTPHAPSPTTDLVKNQLKDTAKARGIPEEEVIDKVLLADQPTKQFVKPEDIGALVLHMCGPHSSSITGACWSIDGGWTAR
jgi:3-hydroxybutyrate dehydrogenase